MRTVWTAISCPWPSYGEISYVPTQLRSTVILRSLIFSCQDKLFDTIRSLCDEALDSRNNGSAIAHS